MGIYDNVIVDLNQIESKTKNYLMKLQKKS
jgi:hypothetical protein